MRKPDRSDLFEVLMSRLHLSSDSKLLEELVGPNLYLNVASGEGKPNESSGISEAQFLAGLKLRRRLINELAATSGGIGRLEINRLINRVLRSSTQGGLDIPELWTRLGKDHLTRNRFRPAINASSFESWRRHTRAADEDLVPLWMLAEMREAGVKSNADLIACLSDWPTFLPGDQPQLYCELSQGIACLHLHLAACYPAPYLWVALMNLRINEDVILSDSVSEYADELQFSDVFSEERRQTLKKLIQQARTARWFLTQMVLRMAYVDDDRSADSVERALLQLESDFTAGKSDAKETTIVDAAIQDSLQKGDNCTDYLLLHIQPDCSFVRCPSLLGERWLNFRLLTILSTKRAQSKTKHPSLKSAFFERTYWKYLEAKSSLLNLLQQGSLFPNWEGFRFCLSRNGWRAAEALKVMGGEIGAFLQESRSVVKLELMIAPSDISETGTASEAGQDDQERAREAVEKYRIPFTVMEEVQKSMTRRLRPDLLRQYHAVQVGCIVHFIKKWDKSLKQRMLKGKSAYRVYHETLRNDSQRRLEGLLLFLASLENAPPIPVVAVDAANTEEYCPPEVFGRVYRNAFQRLRFYMNSGKVIGNRRTYHVGEVFPYLGTGLRRIYEALRFLELRAGDRVGHACALGLDVDDYLKRNPTVELSELDQLDDAVFEWHLLTEYAAGEDFRINYLERRIAERAEAIYGEAIPASTLCQAWLMRGNDFLPPGSEEYGEDSVPLWIQKQGRRLRDLTREMNHQDDARVGAHSFFRSLSTLAEMAPAKRSKRSRYLRELPRNQAERICHEYLYDVTTIQNSIRQNRADVSAEGPHLRRIQQILRKVIADAGVAIESNPTSNWLIAGCERLSDIPAVQWELKHPDELTVTINPDDPAVFSTSIENEYFFMFVALQQGPNGLSRGEALDRIRKLRINALEASFLQTSHREETHAK